MARASDEMCGVKSRDESCFERRSLDGEAATTGVFDLKEDLL